MRHQKIGCGRCSRKVCCCARGPAGLAGSTGPMGPEGPEGSTGPAGLPGSNGLPGSGSALYKWSGRSASPGGEALPGQHSDNGTGGTGGEVVIARIEYPIVGDQTPDEFRVNLLDTIGGEDNTITFTLYLRRGIALPVAIATIVYETGESGQKSNFPIGLLDGDTIALESTASGVNIGGIQFTAVLR